jgi:hypothetical protein
MTPEHSLGLRVEFEPETGKHWEMGKLCGFLRKTQLFLL